MTMSPARVSAGGRTSESFGAASATVIPASIESPIGSGESADRPDGRSIETIGIPEPFTSATTVSMSPDKRRVQAGAEDGIHDESAVADFREVKLPRLAVGDLDHGHAEPAENVEVRPGVAADLGDLADQKDQDVDVALQQRTRHHEAVAAVVAAPAEDRHLPFQQIAVHGLHGRNHLPSGVLHEHERGNTDLLDRPAIGLAHLSGGQDSHR